MVVPGGAEVETPEGGEVEGGGAAGEAVEWGAVVGGGDGAGGVGVPVAVVAEEEVVGGAADGDGLGAAVVADLGAEVLPREQVGRVHVLVAQQAQLRRVRPAVQHRHLVAAEIARHALVPRPSPTATPRSRAHHFSINFVLPHTAL